MDNILFIAKSPLAGEVECGAYNGYVAVPPTSKFYGAWEMDLLDIDVHGGVTFAESAYDDAPYEETNAPGVDTASSKCEVLKRAIFLDGAKDVPDDWWIIGFDTCHFGDTHEKWDKEAVIKETRRLSEQLVG